MNNKKDKWIAIEGFWLVEQCEESDNLFAQGFSS